MGHKSTYISLVIIALLFRDVTSDVSCSAGTFSRASKGFVRCEFGKDVRQGTHQIIVVHCGGADVCSSTKSYPLACNIDAGKLECTSVLPGYTFDGQVDSSLTLFVTNMSETTTGVYRCQVLPNDGSSVSSCNLDKHTETSPFEPTGTDTTNSKSSSEVDENASRPTPRAHIIAFAVLAVAATLLLTSNIVTCCWARRKAQRKRSHTKLVYEMEEVQQQRNKKNGYLCWTSQKQKPTLEVEEEELVMPARIFAEYPPNYVHKSTQKYVDVLDKYLQVGSPVLRTADVETQLGKKDDFPNLNKISDTAPGVKTGSVLRYNNPYYTITHLGKREVLPVPNVATQEQIRVAHIKAMAAKKEVQQAALPSSSSDESFKVVPKDVLDKN